MKKSVFKKNDLIFYVLMAAWPVFQFCVFYLGVNFNSIALSFQRIDLLSNTVTFVGFENFKDAITLMTGTPDMLVCVKNSLIVCAVSLFVGVPLVLLFSYYLYKKMPGTGAFRILLFMPSIVSPVIMATVFRFFVERAVPAYINEFFSGEMKGLLESADTRFITLLFYNVWVSFGVSMLMYCDSMSSISPELTDAGKIDGVNSIQEFLLIVLPLIFPTITTFVIVSLSTLFSNQLNLYSFYGSGAPMDVRTYGYWLFTKTSSAASQAEYPQLATVGLLLTVVTLPITLSVRKLCEKFGPSVD